MILHIAKVWEAAAASALIAGLAGWGVWLYARKRPTQQELELARREFLTRSGRLVDGTVLDVCEIPVEGRSLIMLMYEYRIGGVDYECSQDITDMPSVISPEQVRAGLPCSVRYQPGNPQNSIVIAERWSGLRTKPVSGSHSPGLD